MNQSTGLRRRTAQFVGGLIAAAVWMTPQWAAAETLTISGTGGDLGAMQMVGDAFQALHPDIEVQVLPSLGSVGGIRAVVAGAINFSISGRVPTDEELANGLSTVAYATTALAFVAALDGDHDSLTTEDLIDIYSGTMLTWQDGEAIRLVLRPETDTDTILIKNKIPELAESLAAAAARRGVQIETSDQHAADRLEHMPEGLGFVSLSLVISENRALKVLELDGVLPSTETIENGTYPLVKTFHFVSRQDRSPAEQSFLDFLHSPVVLEILANTGHGLVGHGA